MEYACETNGAFAPGYPGLQIIWDSTSLGLLKDCPRKYYLTMIEGWSWKQTPLPLYFGILIHQGIEALAHFRAEGLSHDDAVDAMVQSILEKCTPWTSLITTNRNVQTLIRSLVWYAEKYKEDPAETIILANGRAAVELSFKMEMDLTAPNGLPYILSGHMDRLARFGSDTWIVDAKHTVYTISSDYFHKYTPDNQMSLYTLASKIVLDEPARGVIIDAMQIAVGFTRFQRGFALRAQEQLDEWLRDTHMWLRMNEEFIRQWHWPMNDKACHHYGGCTYRGICKQSQSVRAQHLNTDFQLKIWDPSVARGE